MLKISELTPDNVYESMPVTNSFGWVGTITEVIQLENLSNALVAIEWENGSRHYGPVLSVAEETARMDDNIQRLLYKLRILVAMFKSLSEEDQKRSPFIRGTREQLDSIQKELRSYELTDEISDEVNLLVSELESLLKKEN